MNCEFGRYSDLVRRPLQVLQSKGDVIVGMGYNRKGWRKEREKVSTNH